MCSTNTEGIKHLCETTPKNIPSNDGKIIGGKLENSAKFF